MLALSNFRVLLWVFCFRIDETELSYTLQQEEVYCIFIECEK